MIKESLEISLEEMDRNLLKNNLSREKSFKVPTKSGLITLKSVELFELILDSQSKEEIRKLVMMIKIIRKRNMSIRQLFQTIAMGLIR